MPDYGLLPEGFVPKTVDVIRTEEEARTIAKFGRLPLGDQTLFGHVIGVVSAAAALVWELAEKLYSSIDRDKASGALLEALSSLNGTFRDIASNSLATETLCGDDATVIPLGTIISSIVSGERFATLADATLVLLTDWVAATAYVLDDQVKNSGNCYRCIVAGTSAGSGGPTTTAVDITDGTVHWTYLGTGEAIADVVAGASVTGPIFVGAGDLTSIDTPVGGLNTAFNLADVVLGHVVQSDQSLRLIGEQELSASGTSPPDSLRGRLLKLVGSSGSATVFTNTDDVTDSDGRPPHSVEALVEGGTDQAILDLLWRQGVAGGIVTYGTTVGTVVDSQGRSQAVRFSRPILVPIYIAVTITVDPTTFPQDGIQRVKDAIASFGSTLPAGTDAVSRRLGAQAFTIDGVDDASPCLIDDAPGPTLEITIPIDLRHRATYSTTNIAVTVVEALP